VGLKKGGKGESKGKGDGEKRGLKEGHGNVARLQAREGREEGS